MNWFKHVLFKEMYLVLVLLYYYYYYYYLYRVKLYRGIQAFFIEGRK